MKMAIGREGLGIKPREHVKLLTFTYDCDHLGCDILRADALVGLYRSLNLIIVEQWKQLSDIVRKSHLRREIRIDVGPALKGVRHRQQSFLNLKLNELKCPSGS